MLRERAAREFPHVRLCEPAPVDDAVLGLAHDAQYIARLVSGDLSRKEITALGFPWSLEMVERSRRSVGATVMACEHALLGRVSDDDLPLLFGCADVSAMLCRSRWGGLEQEGFGIVFAEAAACGVPQLAGNSGGAAEAVSDGETGFVVDRPDDEHAVANAIERLLDDPELRSRMALASRRRAEREFSYDVLSNRLARVLGVSA